MHADGGCALGGAARCGRRPSALNGTSHRARVLKGCTGGEARAALGVSVMPTKLSRGDRDESRNLAGLLLGTNPKQAHHNRPRRAAAGRRGAARVGTALGWEASQRLGARDRARRADGRANRTRIQPVCCCSGGRVSRHWGLGRQQAEAGSRRQCTDTRVSRCPRPARP